VTRRPSMRSPINWRATVPQTNREHDHAATDATPTLESSRVVNAAISESISKSREPWAGQGMDGHRVFRFEAFGAAQGRRGHPRGSALGRDFRVERAVHGPVLVTPVLLMVGLRGTPILLLPVLVMAAVLVARLRRTVDGRSGQRRASVLPAGVDNWPAFGRLIAVVVVRSILFFGLTTFLALHFIRLGASQAEASGVLTIFLVSGAAGTGMMSPRSSRARTDSSRYRRIAFPMIRRP